MKIEIGKIYKTRDGRKAFIYNYRQIDNVWVGVVVNEGAPSFIYWDDNGRFIPDEERPEDLTGEWE